MTLIWTELRRRTKPRAAFIVGGLLLVSLGIAALLQLLWAQVNLYTGLAPRFVFRWFAMTCVAETLLLLPLAVCAGAGAIVAEVGSGRLQQWRVTPLSPTVMVASKTFGALWHLALTVCASAGWWGGVAVATGNLALAAALLTHFLLLVMATSFGCLAACGAALLIRGGQGVWAQAGASLGGLMCLVVASAAVFLANPLIRALDHPQMLISAALAVNPFTAVSAAAGVDALRTDWLYGLSVAPEYAFTYPPAWVTAAIYAAVGWAALWGAARIIRNG